MESNRPYNYDAVRLPDATIGTCKYYRRCGNFDVTLGNGVCMDCWDRGMDKRQTDVDSKRRKNEAQRARYRLRVTRVKGHIE